LEGKLFREGAECEARERRAMHGRHRELVDCAEELANAHQDWTSGDIALALARIFNHTIEEEPV
jgi:hypothetical protein